MKKLLFSSLMLVMAALTVSAANKLTATASTNMEQYESNPITNVTDGNNSTIFWKNGAQAQGDYILLTLGASYQIGNINLVFSADGNDKPVNAKIQYSSDNSDWMDVPGGTVSTEGSSFSCDAGGATAQYVRLYITALASNWLKIAEFEVYEVDVTKTATPVFNPVSTTFDIGAEGKVTITSEEGATIYYTLDGTEPTADSPLSIQHGETVSVPTVDWTVTTTIKAVAKAEDKELSNVATATYMVQSPYCQPNVPTNGTNASYVGQIVTLTTTGAQVDANWTNPKTENYNGHVGVIGNTFTAEAGQTVTLNITSKNTNWGAIRVYVDLNGSQTFDEGENIARVGTTSDNSDTKAVNQEFTIDAATQPGIYLMRVFYVARSTTDDVEFNITDPCGTYAQGGYYDFAFNVVEATVATHTVTVEPAEAGQGTVEYAIADGGKTAVAGTDVAVLVTDGQTITLTATAATGYTFSKWVNGEGTELSTANPYTYTPTADITISAEFAKDEATGLSENVASRFSAVAMGNCVKVSGVPAGETINVYTVNSVLVASTVAAEGVNEIVVPAQGVLLVKAGSQVVKVIK